MVSTLLHGGSGGSMRQLQRRCSSTPQQLPGSSARGSACNLQHIGSIAPIVQSQRKQPPFTCSSSATSSEQATNSTTISVRADPQASTSGRSSEWDRITLEGDLGHECSFYDWKWGSRVNYIRAGRTGPPLLLCHGFGVGAYHFERNISELAKQHRVYAVDLLGQGASWPSDVSCAVSGPLRFSADTWTEQLHHFITERIGEPVYIAGNSLGGYLGANLAARHPDAVKGLILLNATPFWSTRPPPGKERLLWRILSADGTVPVPQVIKRTIERMWWDKIRNPETIRSLLQLVYARPQTIDEQLLQRIVQATQHPSALDAFTSIMLSPRTELTFDEMLEAIRCPVCMAYGRDDPWVTRAWGHRLKRQLPAAQYLELSPAGHCPHHEAPAAVNTIIQTWVTAVEQGQHQDLDLLQVGSRVEFIESDGQVIEVTCQDGLPRTDLERWDYAQWRLGKALAQLTSRAAAAFRKQQPEKNARN